MTREEAMQVLKDADRNSGCGICLQDGLAEYDEQTDRYRILHADEALDMAISALSAKPSDYACWLESIIVTDEPCWLCEYSIDDEWCHKNCGTKTSIQAECLRHFFKVLSADTEQTEPSDLISRTELIKQIEPYVDNTCKFLKPKELIQYINELPSVSAERVGEWIDLDGFIHKAWHCSKCNNIVSIKTNYCGDCGAKMKGGSE